MQTIKDRYETITSERMPRYIVYQRIIDRSETKEPHVPTNQQDFRKESSVVLKEPTVSSENIHNQIQQVTPTSTPLVAIPIRCASARRRVGKTYPGQDPLSYRIGNIYFHTFRAMNPDNGCLCLPLQMPRCQKPCRRIVQMRRENYLNAMWLLHLPAVERHKVFRTRDPMTVLLSRAQKYNARFIETKVANNEHYVFYEMVQMDKMCGMMKETYL